MGALGEPLQHFLGQPNPGWSSAAARVASPPGSGCRSDRAALVGEDDASWKIFSISRQRGSSRRSPVLLTTFADELIEDNYQLAICVNRDVSGLFQKLATIGSRADDPIGYGLRETKRWDAR